MAQRAGAIVWEGCRASGICRESAQQVSVQTSNGEIFARYLIGADGANGVIARHLNSRSSYFWQTALYCEVPGDSVRHDSIRPSTMRIDWGSLPSGYGWIFPKGGGVNIGVGCPSVIARVLRPYLRRFIEREGILKPNTFDKLQFRGHPLPTLTPATRLSSDKVILVGDAAGLVEPLTGEGISNACQSAEIASQFIMDNLNRSGNEEPYDRRIRTEIGCEITWARQLLCLAVAFPKTVFRRFRTDDRVWEAFCHVLGGEASFLSLRQAVLGRLDMLSAPLHRFSEWQEKYRLLRGGRPVPEGKIAKYSA